MRVSLQKLLKPDLPCKMLLQFKSPIRARNYSLTINRQTRLSCARDRSFHVLVTHRIHVKLAIARELAVQSSSKRPCQKCSEEPTKILSVDKCISKELQTASWFKYIECSLLSLSFWLVSFLSIRSFKISYPA